MVNYLCDSNVIREEKGKPGVEPHYTFYSEEEMKVAELIKNQNIDSKSRSKVLVALVQKYFSMSNKTQFMNRSFTVGGEVMNDYFLTTNNPDVVVDIDMDDDTVEDMILRNTDNRLLFLAGPLFHENRRLRNDFSWYCKVNRYMQTNPSNDENAKVREEFTKRAQEIYDNSIKPGRGESRSDGKKRCRTLSQRTQPPTGVPLSAGKIGQRTGSAA